MNAVNPPGPLPLQPLQTEREQVLFVMANAAARMGELLYPTGSLPAGISINTTLQGPQGPVKPAAPKAASGGFMGGLLAAVKALFYYAAGEWPANCCGWGGGGGQRTRRSSTRGA